MRLRYDVVSMCLLCASALWQQLLFFAGFSIRRWQGRIGSFEIPRDCEYQSIQASRYSNCQPDSPAAQSSVLIFPDPDSSEETGPLVPRADEPARQRERSE